MSRQKASSFLTLLNHLSDFSSPSQIQQPDDLDEIVDDTLDVACPYTDDIEMSEQDSADCELSPSGNEEGLLEFPSLSDDEGCTMLDAEMDSIMPDLGILVDSDSELEGHTSLKVTQVRVHRRSRGQHANQCLQCKERGSLRRQVDEVVGTARMSTSKKRKTYSRFKPGQGPTMPVTPRLPLIKKGNTFHGGLKKNWKTPSNRCKYLYSV